MSAHPLVEIVSVVIGDYHIQAWDNNHCPWSAVSKGAKGIQGSIGQETLTIPVNTINPP